MKLQTLDAGINPAAQRLEHREIAAYGSAITFARHLNRNEVASLLQESLDDEKPARDPSCKSCRA